MKKFLKISFICIFFLYFLVACTSKRRVNYLYDKNNPDWYRPSIEYASHRELFLLTRSQKIQLELNPEIHKFIVDTNYEFERQRSILIKEIFNLNDQIKYYLDLRDEIKDFKAREVLLDKATLIAQTNAILIESLFALNSEFEMLYVVYKTNKEDFVSPKIKKILEETNVQIQESRQIQKDLKKHITCLPFSLQSIPKGDFLSA